MRTRIIDYARVNTGSRVTTKQTVLAIVDAIISGLVILMFVTMILAVLWITH